MILALIVVLYRHVPTGFLPTEDKGFFVVAAQLPSGASLQRTRAVVAQIEKHAARRPGRQATVALVGLDILSSANQPNSAVIFVGLKPWDERGKNESADAILGAAQWRALRDARRARLRLQLSGDSRARHHVGPRAQPAGARRAGRRRSSTRRSTQFMQALAKEPAVVGAATTFRIDAPQIFLNVDRDAVKAHDVAAGHALPDAADDAVDALHQRLQPVRPHLSGAGRGGAAVPAVARRHRPPLRAQRRRPDDPGLDAGAAGVPHRPEHPVAVQRLHVGAGHGAARARAQLGPDAGRGRRTDRPRLRQQGRRATPTAASRTRKRYRAARAA